MAFQRIRIKNTNVVGKIPGADKLDVAELCINLKDQKLFSKDADGNVFELGGRVESGDTPPSNGNEIGDLFWDGDFLLVWNGTEWESVTGNLQQVTDKGNTTDNSIQIGTGWDGGNQTGVSISDDGHINVIKRTGSVDLIYATTVFLNLDKTFKVDYEANVSTDGQITSGMGTGASSAGVQLSPAGNLTIVNENGTDLISAEGRSGATNTFTVDEDAHVTTTGSVTCVFGTSTAQLGNVAPLNDWSCYPARA